MAEPIIIENEDESIVIIADQGSSVVARADTASSIIVTTAEQPVSQIILDGDGVADPLLHPTIGTP
jgi:hypothetical protein